MIIKLPKELLQTVVEYLVYDIRCFEQQFPQLRWHYPATQLIPLSLVSRQLRRICSPYIFAYVETKTEGIGRLKDQCITNQDFAMSIRVLRIREYRERNILDWPDEEEKIALIHLLPRLNNLLQLNLKNILVDTLLLAAINNHTLSTVVVDFAWFAPSQGPRNLAKICLEVEGASAMSVEDCRHLEPYLSRGMQVTQISIHDRQFLTYTLPKVTKLTGLTELELVLHRETVTQTWLDNLASSHPLLAKITITLPSAGQDFRNFRNSHPCTPYFHFFWEKVRFSHFWKMTTVLGFALTRAKRGMAASSADLWVVGGLNLYVVDMSSTPILQLVRSEFPQISTLTIRHGTRAIQTAPAKDFIDVLSSFPCLRVIGLINTLGYLNFGEELVQRPQNSDPVQTRAATMQYASRLACAIPSIKALFIHEEAAFKNPTMCIQGWIDGDELRHSGAKSTLHRVPVAYGGPSSCATYYV